MKIQQSPSTTRRRPAQKPHHPRGDIQLPPTPWTDRIVRTLSDRQLLNDRNRYNGLTEFALKSALGIESGADEVRGFEAGLRTLSGERLIEIRGSYWRLTATGWQRAGGTVPGSERDDQFVRALIQLDRDPAGMRVPNSRIRASSVYEHLGWTWNQFQALTIAERLDGKLVNAQVQGPDAWLQPTAEAFQQFPAS